MSSAMRNSGLARSKAGGAQPSRDGRHARLSRTFPKKMSSNVPDGKGASQDHCGAWQLAILRFAVTLDKCRPNWRLLMIRGGQAWMGRRPKGE